MQSGVIAFIMALVMLTSGGPSGQDAFGQPVEECEPAPLAWFDDVVFVGDSITVQLQNYCDATGALGNAQFLCAISLSATTNLWEITEDSYHPFYNGTKVHIEDGVAACGLKNIYIMLGINNIKSGVPAAVDDMRTLLDAITQKVPDCHIIIQSVTPMLSDSKILSEQLNNDAINAYNQEMQALCAEHGWYYLDVASVLKAPDGGLLPEFCSDADSMGLHINDAATEVWVDYLLTHVPQELAA